MTSLYIHIPFCFKKCFYCSFAVAVAQQSHIDNYLTCLEKEIQLTAFDNSQVSTIYFGGGTPTLLSPQQLARLVKIVQSHFIFSPDAEWTIEANPESVDFEKACFLKGQGINRVSLGIQSFNDKYLEFLGRNHKADDARAAFSILRKAGFQNISIDVMCGLPKQSFDEVEQDIREAAQMQSEHVSLYFLNVEPKSRFYAKNVKEQKGGEAAEYYERVVRLLEERGLRQYEISNFARPGYESQHNIHYWRGGNYVGLGVGAHSHKDGKRSWNVGRLKEYFSLIQKGQSPVEEKEVLTTEQRLLEAVLFGLRMNEGVDVRVVEEKFGCCLSKEKEGKVEEFVREGFLEREGSIVRATLKGRKVLDELSSYLI